MARDPMKRMRRDALIPRNIWPPDLRGLSADATWTGSSGRQHGTVHALDNGLFLDSTNPLYNSFVGWDRLVLNDASPTSRTLLLSGYGNPKLNPTDGIVMELTTASIEYDLRGHGTFDQWWTLFTVVHPLKT